MAYHLHGLSMSCGGGRPAARSDARPGCSVRPMRRPTACSLPPPCSGLCSPSAHTAIRTRPACDVRMSHDLCGAMLSASLSGFVHLFAQAAGRPLVRDTLFLNL